MGNGLHVFDDQSYDSLRRASHTTPSIQHANERTVVPALDDESFPSLFPSPVELESEDSPPPLYDLRHSAAPIWCAPSFKALDGSWVFEASPGDLMHS